MRLVFFLALLIFTNPAFGSGAESLVKKVPNSKTRSVVVGKTPVFNIPAKEKATDVAKLRLNTPKFQRTDAKGTVLNQHQNRKDGWGHPVKTLKEQADDFVVNRTSRAISR